MDAGTDSADSMESADSTDSTDSADSADLADSDFNPHLDCLGYFKTQIIIISSSSCGVTVTQFIWQTIKGF